MLTRDHTHLAATRIPLSTLWNVLNVCDPFLTGATLTFLEMSTAHIINRRPVYCTRHISVIGRPFVKPVRPMLSDRCLSCLSACDVGVLRPNAWTDQDETWNAGRPRPWPPCVRWGPTSPSPKGHSPPIFGPYLLLSLIHI